MFSGGIEKDQLRETGQINLQKYILEKHIVVTHSP